MNQCWYCRYYDIEKAKEPCKSCGDKKQNYILWLLDNEDIVD